MSPAKVVLFTALGVFSAIFAVQWLRLARDPRRRERPTLSDLGIGLLTNFLDALGIGRMRRPPRSTSSAAGRAMSSFPAPSMSAASP